jgi:predicted dehydrogenase
MTEKQIGIAFAGAGIVAEMHGRGVAANKQAKFIGAYDRDGAKAEAIAKKFGGRAFSDLHDLLADPLVDAVHVLTPTQHHVSTALASLNAGKHVLIEKPLAESREEIAKLRGMALQSGRVCMPGHNYIYAPSLQRAKRLVQSGKLGKIASLWILYNIFHSEDIAAIYGGVLRAVCMHHAYSLLYLLGRPRRLSSMISRVHYDNLACEDQAMITCEMPDGALANLWCSFAASDPTNDPWTVTYKLLGTKGGVNYSWNEAQFEDLGGPAWGMPCYEESFIGEIAHFVSQCILQGKPPLSTLEDAADALCILEAAERTAKAASNSELLKYE